jgi:vacuolar-type H+-ATPase subunit H
MEVPPEDEELQRILEEAEKGTTEKKDEIVEDTKTKEEKTVDDDIDYNSMKVVELKELLKERKLPVSGTKAELIERLQT